MPPCRTQGGGLISVMLSYRTQEGGLMSVMGSPHPGERVNVSNVLPAPRIEG